MSAVIEALAILLGIGIVVMLARLVNRSLSDLGARGDRVRRDGITEILELSTGRKVYVGRSCSNVWLHLPSLEVSFTPAETRELASAIFDHGQDAEVYAARHEKK